ncbi:MAG: trypsin-like serine protease [Planctomycetia bacterium]|nr:trypsin-like serine protease [Planctomycetia bacterium]
MTKATASKKASEKSQKLERRLAVDSLEERVLLSVTPNTPYDVLVNTEYSENQTTETNGNCIAIDEDGDFVVVWTRGDNVYRATHRSAFDNGQTFYKGEIGWYDSEGEIHLFTDRDFINGYIVTDLGVRVEVELESYIDPDTGTALTDSNIYARYFTDEHQRLYVDTSDISDENALSSLVLQTGDKCVQKISFSSLNIMWDTIEMPSSVPVNAEVTLTYFEYLYDADGEFLRNEAGEILRENVQTATFMYRDSSTPLENARELQAALVNMLGNVEVSVISATEFEISFDAVWDENSNMLKSGLLETSIVAVQEGFIPPAPLPTSLMSWVEIPERVVVDVAYEDFVNWNIDAAGTAERIYDAFEQLQTTHVVGATQTGGPATDVSTLRTWNHAIRVTPVVGVGGTEDAAVIAFDIYFVDSSGKQNVQQIEIVNSNVVTRDTYNDRVRVTATGEKAKVASLTLKQNSEEFRVNPTTDESWNWRTQIYTTTDQVDPSVAMDFDGDFVISWTGEVLQTRYPGSFTDVFVRTYTPKMYQTPDGIQTVLDGSIDTQLALDKFREAQELNTEGNALVEEAYDNHITPGREFLASALEKEAQAEALVERAETLEEEAEELREQAEANWNLGEQMVQGGEYQIGEGCDRLIASAEAKRAEAAELLTQIDAKQIEHDAMADGDEKTALATEIQTLQTQYDAAIAAAEAFETAAAELLISGTDRIKEGEALKATREELQDEADALDLQATALRGQAADLRDEAAQDRTAGDILIADGQPILDDATVILEDAARLYAEGNAILQAAKAPTVIEDGRCYIVTSDTMRVNSTLTGPQFSSSVAMDREGNYVVVWASSSQESSYYNAVYMQRYDRNGNRIGSEERVDIEVTGTAMRPQVAISPDGTQICVTWDWLEHQQALVTPEEQRAAVYLRLYGYTDVSNTSSFVTLTDPVVVDTGVFSSVTFNESNQFAIAWQVNDRDNDSLNGAASTSTGVRMSQYVWNIPTDGSITDGALQVTRDQYRPNSSSLESDSTTTWAWYQMYAKVAMDADGDILVGYTGFGPDVSENIEMSPALVRYIAELINDDTNADLLEYFDPENEIFAFTENTAYDNAPAYGSQTTWVHNGEAYVTNGDVDSIIQMILAVSQQDREEFDPLTGAITIVEGATDEQLSRLGAILYSIMGVNRGESNGIFYTQYDSDVNMDGTYDPGETDTLYSDNIVNSLRDGSNAKFYIQLNRSASAIGANDFVEDDYVWDTIAFDIGVSYQDPKDSADGQVWPSISGTLLVQPVYRYVDDLYLLNNEATALAIRNAIQDWIGENAAWANADNLEGCVEVRALSTDNGDATAMRAYDDTYWDLNMEDVAGNYWGPLFEEPEIEEYPMDHTCFEVSFTGNLHDTAVSFAWNQQSSVRQACRYTWSLPTDMNPVDPLTGNIANGYFFRLQIGNNEPADSIIQWTGNLEALRAGVAEAMGLLGYGDPQLRVEVGFMTDENGDPILNDAGEEVPYFTVTLGGDRAGEDIANLRINVEYVWDGDGDDRTLRPECNGLAPLTGAMREERIQGTVIIQALYGVKTNSEGDFGTIQNFFGVGMEGDGDFTFAWTQYDRTAQGTTVASNEIYARTFNEEQDALGPQVVDVVYQNGQKISEGAQVTNSGSEPMGAMIVTFTEELVDHNKWPASSRSEYESKSVTNTENWTLLKDGQVVVGAIKEVVFGMNRSAEDDVRALGVTPLAENKWEAVVIFNDDINLEDGTYVLLLDNTVEDINGNVLGSRGNNVDGDDFERVFNVISGDDDEEPVSKYETDDDGNIVLDDQGNPVVSVDDEGNPQDSPGNQQFFDPNDVTSDDIWAPNATAMDYEGDTVTVWTEEGKGIKAQIEYAKWEEIDGVRTMVLDQAVYSEVISVTNNSTASFASVAMDGEGRFVVTWTQDDRLAGATTADLNVWAQMFDLNGEALTDAFMVNTTTENAQKYSQVAMSLNGDFVVTWQSYSRRTGWDVYYQRYDSDAQPLGGRVELQTIQIQDGWTGEFTLTYTDEEGNSYTTDRIAYEGRPQVGAENILAALNKLKADNAELADLTFNVYAMSATEIVVEIGSVSVGGRDVNELELRTIAPPAGTVVDGNITITTLQDGKGGEELVNETTANDQRYASIGMDYDGNFVISWTGYGQDGDGVGESNVYARMYTVTSNTTTTTSAVTERTSYTTEVTTGTTGTAIEGDVPVGENAWCLIGPLAPDEYVTTTKSGVGMIVAAATGATTGSLGSGSVLTTGRHVLTAAHVVCKSGSNVVEDVITVTFMNADGTTFTVDAEEVYVHEEWTGQAGATAGDIAIIVLAEDVSDRVETYDINRSLAADLGQVYERYGYGLTGTGEEGEDEAAGVDGQKRTGKNKWESLGSTVGLDSRLLIYDFDDGTEDMNYIFDRHGVTTDLGLGEEETICGSGDSGGPCFVNGVIAGVCQGVYAEDGGADGTYGDIGLDTRVAMYATWIDGITGAGGQDIVTPGDEFLVNVDFTTSGQKWSSVALDADGDFVITWTSLNQDGVGDGYGANRNGLNGVYAQRYTSDGARVNTSFLVNTTVENDQQLSKVAIDADGDFVIVWESFQEHGDGTTIGTADNWGIYGQRYASSDKLATLTYLGENGEIGGEFQVNTTVSGDQRFANVVLSHTGDMKVSWQSDQSGSDGLFSRFYKKTLDDTGSVVVRVGGEYEEPLYDEDGEKTGETQTVYTDIADGMEIVAPLEYIDITFGEQMMGQYASERGSNSVLYYGNWEVLFTPINTSVINNVTSDLIDSIELIGYDESDASYNGGEHQKDIYRVNFNTDAMADGTYRIRLRERVEDRFGNTLDGDGDGTSGGDFTLEFIINSNPDNSGSLVPPTQPDDPDSDENDINQVVNMDAANKQDQPDVAMNDQGDYLVVWSTEVNVVVEDEEGDGTEEEETPTTRALAQRVIMGQWYDRYGAKSGSEFTISGLMDGVLDGNAENPKVAMDQYGNFVVTWAVNGRDENSDGVVDANETANYDVYARVYDVFGNSSEVFRVNQSLTADLTTGVQHNPSVAISPDGKQFVITWAGINSGSSLETYGIFAQRYSITGLRAQAIGETFIVNEVDIYSQDCSTVAMDSNYNIVVAWQCNQKTSTATDIFARKFNANNQALGSSFVVNTTVVNDQNHPDISMNDIGQFIVGWSSQSGSGYDVRYQCFDSDCSKIGGEGKANTFDKLNQLDVSVTIARRAEHGTAFAISWTSFGQEGTSVYSEGVFVRDYTDIRTQVCDTATGLEVRVNAYTPGNENASAIAMDAFGSYAVAWVGPDSARSNSGVLTEDTDIFQRVYIRKNSPGYEFITRTGTTATYMPYSVTPSTNSGSGTGSGTISTSSVTSVAENAKLENGGATILESQSSITIQAAQSSHNELVFSGTQRKFVLNGVELTLSGTNSSYVFDASLVGKGSAAVVIQGVGGESVKVSGGEVQIVADDYTLTIRNATSFVFNGDGTASAVFETSGSGDSLEASGQSAVLVSLGGSFRVAGCNSISVTSKGGADSASISSATGADTVEIASNSVISSGEDYRLEVVGFTNVATYGGAGDSVTYRVSGGALEAQGTTLVYTLNGKTYSAGLYDSVEFIGNKTTANIATDAGADAIVANATGVSITTVGGALMNFSGLSSCVIAADSADSASIVATSSVEASAQQIKTGGVTIQGVGSATIEAGGASVALSDSASDDVFTLRGTNATLVSDGYSISVANFGTLSVVSANGGTDSASLYDSSARDSFALAEAKVTFNNGVTIEGFATVAAVSSFGSALSITGTEGNDEFTLAYNDISATLNGTQFVGSGFGSVTLVGGGGKDVLNAYDTAGDDTFDLAPGSLTMSGENYRYTASGIAQISVKSVFGGSDTLNASDSTGNDTLVLRPEWMSLTSASGNMITASGFASIAVASSGGNDVAIFYDSVGDDTIRATNDNTLTMSNESFFNSVAGFRKVNVYSVMGGDDSAIYDSLFTPGSAGGLETLTKDKFDISLLAVEQVTRM